MNKTTLFETSISWAFPYYMFTNINGTEISFNRYYNIVTNDSGSSFDSVDDDLAYTLRYGILGSILLRSVLVCG